jgi:hypothetical protein
MGSCLGVKVNIVLDVSSLVFGAIHIEEESFLGIFLDGEVEIFGVLEVHEVFGCATVK